MTDGQNYEFLDRASIATSCGKNEALKGWGPHERSCWCCFWRSSLIFARSSAGNHGNLWVIITPGRLHQEVWRGRRMLIGARRQLLYTQATLCLCSNWLHLYQTNNDVTRRHKHVTRYWHVLRHVLCQVRVQPTNYCFHSFMLLTYDMVATVWFGIWRFGMPLKCEVGWERSNILYNSLFASLFRRRI